MKLIVMTKELTLKKEQMELKFGDVFEVDDLERVQEILNYRFNGQAVVNIVQEEIENKNNIKDLEIENKKLKENNSDESNDNAENIQKEKRKGDKNE